MNKKSCILRNLVKTSETALSLFRSKDLKTVNFSKYGKLMMALCIFGATFRSCGEPLKGVYAYVNATEEHYHLQIYSSIEMRIEDINNIPPQSKQFMQWKHEEHNNSFLVWTIAFNPLNGITVVLTDNANVKYKISVNLLSSEVVPIFARTSTQIQEEYKNNIASTNNSSRVLLVGGIENIFQTIQPNACTIPNKQAEKYIPEIFEAIGLKIPSGIAEVGFTHITQYLIFAIPYSACGFTEIDVKKCANENCTIEEGHNITRSVVLTPKSDIIKEIIKIMFGIPESIDQYYDSAYSKSGTKWLSLAKDDQLFEFHAAKPYSPIAELSCFTISKEIVIQVFVGLPDLFYIFGEQEQVDLSQLILQILQTTLNNKQKAIFIQYGGKNYAHQMVNFSVRESVLANKLLCGTIINVGDGTFSPSAAFVQKFRMTESNEKGKQVRDASKGQTFKITAVNNPLEIGNIFDLIR